MKLKGKMKMNKKWWENVKNNIRKKKKRKEKKDTHTHKN
jgi:hypothetical protein